jgi:peptide/nickel transport system ATP-binding protein
VGSGECVLDVRDLATYFFTPRGCVRAVDGVSFSIERGVTLALVGESGCGKSATALSVMRLVPSPPGLIVRGSVKLDGRELLSLSEAEMCSVRGGDAAMIFQEPMTSLNPVYTVGAQVVEAIMAHHAADRRKARELAIELLHKVGIPSPAQRASDYPHQLSGGMRQRVMIAMALAARPRLLIADEPTTALDVTVQAQILDLISSLQEELNMAVLLITHDFGIVRQAADRVAVMYAGQIVEQGSAGEVLNSPKHPYTRALIDSVPVVDAPSGTRLVSIDGAAPNLLDPPAGCRFHPRCSRASARCREFEPELAAVGSDTHIARCAAGGGLRYDC